MTYTIDDGVRRAKAADLAGQKEIWATVQGGPEQKLPVDSLLSPKKEVNVTAPDALARWISVKQGMAAEPDLFPPINVRPGTYGIPIRRIPVVGEPPG